MARVSAETRDRLAELAADRGMTIGEAVRDLAVHAHTTVEVAANRERLARPASRPRRARTPRSGSP